MKITEIRTVYLKEFPNLCWVEIATDEGLRGIGETFFGPAAVSAYIHETAAPYLLGLDPTRIDRHWRELYGYYLRFGGLGAEQRGASALDMALWDIFAKSCGTPLYAVLGGRTRDFIRAYNTCGGYGYSRMSIEGHLDDDRWSNVGTRTDLGYEDLDAFMHRPEDLAISLVEEGFTAMKIWPFDRYAVPSDGALISADDLTLGCEPFRRIRDAVGTRIEVACELHSRWTLAAAKRIARALEAFDPMWYEDPLRMDSLAALCEFARSTRIPTMASELLATKSQFAELLEKHVIGYVMIDFGWIGGLSEARKVATMADAYHLPVCPHDCTGPVSLAVGVHFCVSQPNAAMQEMVRAFYSSWYQDLVTELPTFHRGCLYPTESAGIGLELQPDLWRRSDAIVRTSLAAPSP